jgi:serine/threonine protein kinase
MKQIGRGGQSQVFLAQHRIDEERMIAIKMPLKRNVNPSAFLEEARILDQLRHPHILQVYDANIEQELPYIVTDCITGGTLRERYPLKTHLPVKQVMAYIKALAHALEHAHHHGIVHGDVKPENVLIGKQGEIILCDFGVATDLQSLQLQPKIVGTRRYMAPEQFEKHHVPASDQYALAIIAWELLNGVNPSIDTMREEIIQKACNEPPLQGSLPLTVRSVLLKALSKAPEQRFDSIISFAVTLESVLQDLDWNELLWGNRASPYPALGEEVTRTTEWLSGPWNPKPPGSRRRESIESDNFSTAHN